MKDTPEVPAVERMARDASELFWEDVTRAQAGLQRDVAKALEEIDPIIAAKVERVISDWTARLRRVEGMRHSLASQIEHLGARVNSVQELADQVAETARTVNQSCRGAEQIEARLKHKTDMIDNLQSVLVFAVQRLEALENPKPWYRRIFK